MRHAKLIAFTSPDLLVRSVGVDGYEPQPGLGSLTGLVRKYGARLSLVVKSEQEAHRAEARLAAAGYGGRFHFCDSITKLGHAYQNAVLVTVDAVVAVKAVAVGLNVVVLPPCAAVEGAHAIPDLSGLGGVLSRLRYWSKDYGFADYAHVSNMLAELPNTNRPLDDRPLDESRERYFHSVGGLLRSATDGDAEAVGAAARLARAVVRGEEAKSGRKEALQAAWPEVVGPTLARKAHLLSIEQGAGGEVVKIGFNNASAAAEFDKRKVAALAAIRAVYGCAGIERIVTVNIG